MSYCDHEGERIECPEICTEAIPHEHWRCPEGHGWIVSLDDNGEPQWWTAWFDLTQPARVIYPVVSGHD